MKRILVLALLMVLITATMGFAGRASIINQQDVIYSSGQAVLWSAATGTTGAKTSNYATFDRPMNNLVCDFVSGISVTTTGVAYTIQANQGTSTTLFDTATNFGIASFSVTGSLTASTIATKTVLATKPFRTIVATITAPTTTQVITITCSATQ